MPEEYEKYNSMAEWIVTHASGISPEYTGEQLAEATADIDTWLHGEERSDALKKRNNARQWLDTAAVRFGYTGYGLESPPLLEKYTATHPFAYHWVAYGFEGEVLDDDDSDFEPNASMVAMWVDIISRRQLGNEGGLKRKVPVNNVVITGPNDYYKKWSMYEIYNAIGL